MILKNEALIVRPILTEKSNIDRIEKNKYYFEVHPKATKHTVKKSLENLFDVQIDKCWIVNVKGKKFKTKQQRISFKKNKKKAIVSLKKDSKVFSFYESF